MLNTSRVIGLAIGGAVVAVAAALALSGCAQPTPRVIPTSQPSVTPVFASDADALAAAEKAYAGYLAASDAIAHDGGNGTDRLAAWDTPAQLKRDERAFAQMKSNGHHTTGLSTFSHVTLQDSDMTTAGDSEVAVYVCLDISHTTLLDASGANVGSGRPLVLPLEVTFESNAPGSQTLLTERSTSWVGTDFCS